MHASLEIRSSIMAEGFQSPRRGAQEATKKTETRGRPLHLNRFSRGASSREIKALESTTNEMYPKVWTEVGLRLEGIFHEMDV